MYNIKLKKQILINLITINTNIINTYLKLCQFILQFSFVLFYFMILFNYALLNIVL